MECEYEVKGNLLRILVPQELDHHVASQIQKETDLLVDTYFIRKIVFDFTRTEFMDSSGIGVILGRYKNLKFSGGSVTARNLNPRVHKIFVMSGLESLIDEERN